MIAHRITTDKSRMQSSRAILAADAARLEAAAKAAGAAYEATRQRMFGIAKDIQKMEAVMFALDGDASDAACQRWNELRREHQTMIDALPEIELSLYAIRDAADAARRLVDSIADLPAELQPRRGLAGAAIAGTF